MAVSYLYGWFNKVVPVAELRAISPTADRANSNPLLRGYIVEIGVLLGHAITSN